MSRKYPNQDGTRNAEANRKRQRSFYTSSYETKHQQREFREAAKAKIEKFHATVQGQPLPSSRAAEQLSSDDESRESMPPPPTTRFLEGLGNAGGKEVLIAIAVMGLSFAVMEGVKWLSERSLRRSIEAKE